jgi:tryptophan-rich sensory protein
MSFLRYALFVVPAILLLGTLSGRVSNSGYSNDWFAALAKPAIMPPGWVFPVAWAILYILLGLALAMVLHARGARGRPSAIAFFLVQLALNYSWSPIFFAAHKVGAAFVVILAMITLTIVTALLFARIRPLAALLLLPYLAWLLFAAALNWQVAALNPAADTLVPGQSSADIPL